MSESLEPTDASRNGADRTDPHAPAYVVGVGSSAGGIEALQVLLSSLPEAPPIAYVVAQHLSPTHDSPLASLLQARTTLKVEVAVHDAALRARTVYVAPPNTDVSVTGDSLVVAAPGGGRGPKPSIDALFRSLAHCWGDRCAGIVLSGTGEDGTEGLRSINHSGGLTIAQAEETARFPAMPRAAAVTGHADTVLAPEAIGPALARVFAVDDRGDAPEPSGTDGSDDTAGSDGTDRTTRADGVSANPSTAESDQVLIDDIVTAVRGATGTNFGDYKASTLRRQIARRQAITKADTLRTYRDLVGGDPEEARALSRGMQVSVTSFFRDPDCWQALRPLVSELVHGLDQDEQLRVWVPGVATGEELYTLAMIAADAMDRPPDLPQRLKLFGTDLDDDALEVARRARYPSAQAAAVPDDDARRWLRIDGDTAEVDPALRACATIAHHDVGSDPPFPRLHIISLRNTLIYFTPELQRRVLRICSFALRPGGLLVLGDTERPGDTEGVFVPVTTDRRIFARSHHAPAVPPLLPAEVPTPEARRPRSTGSSAPETDRRSEMQDALIRMYTPPSLVIDEHDEVIEAIGNVTPWCWVADGRYSSHIVALVRDELRPAMRSLLVQLRHGSEPVVARRVASADGDVVLTARGIGSGPECLAVVGFEAPAEPGVAPDDDGGTATAPLLARGGPAPGTVEFDDELELARRALEATVEELGASNEELQASSEELQASNEELEAANEELATVNEELQVRSSQLQGANTDLENVQGSLDSGMVLLDNELRVRRFNPQAVRLFALIDSDIGRPLTAIPSTIVIPDLESRLRAVLTQSESTLVELQGGATEFLVHFQPYRGSGGEVLGAIVVATDVTEVAGLRRALRRSMRDLENITHSLREVVWRRDGAGTLTFVNEAVEAVTGLRRTDVLADPELLALCVHPDDRDRVRRVAAAAEGRRDLQYRIARPDGTERWVYESVITMEGEEDGDSYTVGSILDITEQNRAEQDSDRRRRILEALFDSTSFGIVLVDSSARISDVNRAFATMTGYAHEALVGTAVSKVIVTGSGESGPLAVSAPGPTTPGRTECRILTRTGPHRLVTVDSHLFEPSGSGGSVLVVIDHTWFRMEQEKLSARARFDQMTGLATRTHFRDDLASRLALAADQGRPVAVLWIALDGFKEVNDRYGHPAGDLALLEVATRLKALVRRHDIVARLAGDEFAVALTGLDDARGLDATALRVLEALRRPVTVGAETVFVSGSVGVAVSPEDGHTGDVLLEHADMAMYEAKKQGRDRCVYFRPEMNEKVHARAEAVQRLRVAIREDEFLMNYQPIVDPVTGVMKAAEALLRWNRDGSMIPAAEFIWLAEETSQIRSLGAGVFHLVRTDLQTLFDATGDSTLPIAVNLSADQLEERSLFDLLTAWDIPGGFTRLIVEVTESAMLDRRGQADETLSLLRRLGGTLSIDDFGTGYSNLSMLDRLRPDIIKLDSSLVQRARDDEQGVALLRASVELARSLGSDLVLEGVETEADQQMAIDLGVQLVQGYHLARPMPIEELVTFVGDADIIRLPQ